MSLNLTGNNLIPYPYYDSSPKTVNGITFTVNNDGSVTANGTSTATANFLCLSLSSLPLKKGEYTLSSGLIDNTSVTYGITFGYKYENSNRTSVATKNGYVSIILTENAMCDVVITVRVNQTLDNLIFFPMLSKGTTVLPYEPYKNINPKNIKVNMSNNLIVYPYRYSSLNYNGIYYTTNDNGEIIANGTIEDDTKRSQFSLNASPQAFHIQKDIYTMSCPMSINDKSHEALFILDFYLDSVWKFIHSVNNTTLLTKTIDLREKEFNRVYGYVIISKEDTGTFENFTFKPMLNKGTTALPYEKYIAPKDVEKVVVAKSPNLQPYPFSDTAINGGITATYNDDGSVTLNGTATADAYFWNVNHKPYLKAGTYTLSGCPEGGSRSTYAIAGSGWKPLEVGNGTTFSVEEDGEKQLGIFIKSGTTVENLTFYPMLNKGTTALPYQKYDREVVWSKTSTTSDEVVDDTTVISDESEENII